MPAASRLSVLVAASLASLLVKEQGFVVIALSTLALWLNDRLDRRAKWATTAALLIGTGLIV